MAYKKTKYRCPFCQIGYEKWETNSGYYDPTFTHIRCDSCGASGQLRDFRNTSIMTRKLEELFKIGNDYRAIFSHLFPDGR